MELYYFYTLKALWNGQGKIKMYHGMPRVRKQLSGKRSILEQSFVIIVTQKMSCEVKVAFIKNPPKFCVTYATISSHYISQLLLQL